MTIEFNPADTPNEFWATLHYHAFGLECAPNELPLGRMVRSRRHPTGWDFVRDFQLSEDRLAKIEANGKSGRAAVYEAWKAYMKSAA